MNGLGLAVLGAALGSFFGAFIGETFPGIVVGMLAGFLISLHLRMVSIESGLHELTTLLQKTPASATRPAPASPQARQTPQAAERSGAPSTSPVVPQPTPSAASQAVSADVAPPIPPTVKQPIVPTVTEPTPPAVPKPVAPAIPHSTLPAVSPPETRPASPPIPPPVTRAAPPPVPRPAGSPAPRAAAMPSAMGATAVSRTAEPVEPDWMAQFWQFLFGGNVVVRVGLIVLFFGVAFLLKYAAAQGFVPVELRYIAVSAGALGLLAMGWRKRRERPDFALLLQGGAIGILFIIVFSALRLHALLPAPFAFVLFILLVVLSGILAVLQDSRNLALFGAAGGFLSPILVSTGQGSHVALFSYYALLNAGVLGIAWFKAWRSLNLTGFLFTFVIGAFWGWSRYGEALFWSTEPFLILFFLMYLGIAVLFAARQPAKWRGYVDGTLVFGLPVVAFGLQAGLVRHIEYGLALSALALGAIYLGLAAILWRRAGEELRLLTESFLALGTVFATLAVPLALDGRWTSGAWALEGAALVWIGVRQERVGARLLGVLLQLGAGLFFLGSLDEPPGEWPVANSRFFGGMFLAFGGLLTAYQMRAGQKLREWEVAFEYLGFAWALLWWFGMTFNEVTSYLPGEYEFHGVVLLFALSALALSEGAHRLRWRTMAMPLIITAPLIFLGAIYDGFELTHLFEAAGGVVWPLTVMALYGVLRRQEGVLPHSALALQHPLALWLILLLLTTESIWAIGQWMGGAEAWTYAAGGAVPMAVLLAVRGLSLKIQWPFAIYRDGYFGTGAIVPMAILWWWAILTALWMEGNPSPLPYLPLVNPLELVQCFVIAGMYLWSRWAREGRHAPNLPPEFVTVALGIAAFVVLNGILARAVHFYAGVDFDWDDLLRSFALQAAFSVAWTLLALGMTAVATRRGARRLWFTGVVLLGIVVAKLFLVDLSASNTMARIVSFLGVGSLMLAMGFFSPLPPREPDVETA